MGPGRGDAVDHAFTKVRGGQRLYVVPNLGLVVAVTAALYASSHGGEPLEENLADDTALNSFVLSAAVDH